VREIFPTTLRVSRRIQLYIKIKSGQPNLVDSVFVNYLHSNCICSSNPVVDSPKLKKKKNHMLLWGHLYSHSDSSTSFLICWVPMLSIY